MASITQLGYLGLGVSDVNEWERFATQILGLQANGRDESGALFLRMDEYHHRFIVHPKGNDDLAYIGWEVAHEHALHAITEQLKASGVTVTPGTPEEAEARRVVGLIKFDDLNGIASEVFYGPLITFENAFKSPRAISGFETGELGLGHIVITVNDLDESLQFYRDVLGMRISDYVQFELMPGVKPKMVFLHCNPRHHTLALLAAPLPKRLMHFLLQVKSLDDVGSTYYFCREQGVPIAGSLGRHTNDHMFSFYLRSPSGFEVEYGWGARVVDDATWQVQRHEAPSMWGHEGLVAKPSQKSDAAAS